MQKRLLVSGYFGEGNIGDDSMLLGFLSGVSDKQFAVTVMSGHPELTSRLYGVPAIDRRNMKLFEAEIKNNDALVFAGGSIFQDVTSIKSVYYYETLIKVAKKAGKQVILLGQGVGPLTTFLGKQIAKKAFEMADVIVVRDPESVQTLRTLGVQKPARQAADLAFLMPTPQEDTNAQNYQAAGMKSIGISVRTHGKKGEILSLFSELAQMMMANRMMPVLIEMDTKEDGQIIYDIEKTQGGKIPSMKNIQTPMQMQQRLMRLDGVIAMRLHAGILATTVGIPPLMLSYDPKVAAFTKKLDLPPALSMQSLTATRVFENLTSILNDKERWKTSLQRNLEAAKIEARANLTILQEVLSVSR